MSQLKNKARREEQRESWSRAIEFYTQALDASRSEGEAFADLSLYNRIGDIYLRIGQKNTAVRYYEQAIERYADQDLHTSAIALCNKVLRVLPERSTVFLQLGRLHLETNLIADARSHFHRYADAMRDRGGEAAAYDALEELIRRTGDPVTVSKWASWLCDEDDFGVVEERVEAQREALADRGIDASEVLEKVRNGDATELTKGQIEQRTVDPLAEAFLTVPEQWAPPTPAASAGETVRHDVEDPAAEDADALDLPTLDPLQETPLPTLDPIDGVEPLPTLAPLDELEPLPTLDPVDGVASPPAFDRGSGARLGHDSVAVGETEPAPEDFGLGSIQWEQELEESPTASDAAPPAGEDGVIPDGAETPAGWEPEAGELVLDTAGWSEEVELGDLLLDLPDASASFGVGGEMDLIEADLPTAELEIRVSRIEAEEAEAVVDTGGLEALGFELVAEGMESTDENEPRVLETVRVAAEQAESLELDVDPDSNGPRAEDVEITASYETAALGATRLAPLEIESLSRSGPAVPDLGPTRDASERAESSIDDRGASTHHPGFDDSEGLDFDAPARTWSPSPESAEANEDPTPAEVVAADWSVEAREAIDRLTASPEPHEADYGLGEPEPLESEAEIGRGAPSVDTAAEEPDEPADDDSSDALDWSDPVIALVESEPSVENAGGAVEEVTSSPVHETAEGPALTLEDEELPELPEGDEVTPGEGLEAVETASVQSEPPEPDASGEPEEEIPELLAEAMDPVVEPMPEPEEIVAETEAGDTGADRDSEGGSRDSDPDLETDTIAVEIPHAARATEEVTGPLAEPRLSAVEEDPEDAFRDWVRSASTSVLRRALPELEQRNEREKALLVIARLCQLEEHNVEYLRRHVVALQELGRLEEAAEACLKLAAALEAQQRPIEARDEYGRALSLAPGDTRAQEGIQRLEEAASAGEAGADDARGSTAGSPKPYTPAHVSVQEPTMIVMHSAPDNGKIVTTPLGGTMRPHDQDGAPRPYSGVAGGAEAASDFEALLSEFRAELHEKPSTSDSMSRTEYGAGLKEMGRLDDAIRELQAAVREPSPPPLAYELLGEAFLEKGQARVAVRLLEKALSTLGHTDREMLGVLYQLGATYERLEEQPKALLCYERIFSVDIDYRDVQARILTCST